MIFGDSLSSTVDWIMSEAVQANTAEAWQAAAAQLRGLNRLLLNMSDHAGPGTYAYARMAMSNTIRIAEQMASDPGERQWWTETMLCSDDPQLARHAAQNPECPAHARAIWQLVNS